MPPVPLHEPAAVGHALAAPGVADALSSSGLVVLHDQYDDHEPGVVLIPDAPPDPPQHDRVRALSPLFRSLITRHGATSIALVVVRSGPATPRGDDYAWHDACRDAGTRVGLASAAAYVLADGVLAQVRVDQPALA